jgi:hypothetical protein
MPSLSSGKMPLQPTDTKNVGNSDDGFRLTAYCNESAVRVDCWGFWPQEVAERFVQETVSGCRNTIPPFHLLVDASDLKPQSEDGQAALQSMLGYLATAKVASVVVSASNILTRMQLNRIANEAGVSSVIAFTDTPPVPWPSSS